MLTTERANKNLTEILRAVRDESQVKVSLNLGKSESYVSRYISGEDLQRAAEFLAACGLKVVPQENKCFSPEYINSLRYLAAQECRRSGQDLFAED